jgi:O-antigen ligase
VLSTRSSSAFVASSRRPWTNAQVCIAIVGVLYAAAVGWNIVTGKWLYLAALAALAATPLVVRWPVQTSLGFYALLMPFDNIAAMGQAASGPAWTKLVGAAAAAVLLGSGLVNRRLTRPPLEALWWTLFILWGALTALWAVNVDLALNRLPTALGLILLYVVSVSVRTSEKELSHVAILTILGGVVAAAYVGYLYSEGVAYRPKSQRASLVAGDRETDPNQMAATLLLPLSLAFGRFVSGRRPLGRLLMLGAMAVMATAVFLTMSRGSVVALLVVVFGYLYKAGVNRQVLIPVVAVAACVPFMPDHFFERLDPSQSHEQLSAGRTTIWEAGLTAVRDYGLFGAGWDTFGQLVNMGAHNIYLGAAVEVGIVGLLLLAAAVLTQLRSARGRKRRPLSGLDAYIVAVYCACLGLLAAGFFLDVIWRKAFWLPWIMLSLGVSVARHREERAAS